MLGGPARVPVGVSEKILQEQQPGDRDQHPERSARGQPVNASIRLERGLYQNVASYACRQRHAEKFQKPELGGILPKQPKEVDREDQPACHSRNLDQGEKPSRNGNQGEQAIVAAQTKLTAATMRRISLCRE